METPTITPASAASDDAGSGATDDGLLSPEALGAQLAQFEVLDLVGRGGMGAVYRARDRQLDRVVAIKTIAPRLGAAPEFEARFSREARALARLEHPGIVRVYSFGEADGLFFLVMEHVDGASLRELLNAGRIEVTEAVELLGQIATALGYAHERGIVHRDVKPENVLLDADGRVHLADFGLARLADVDHSFALTRTGLAVGTPMYMAPEQLRKEDAVGARADVYALGVMAYEMLTGELPVGRFGPPSSRTADAARYDDLVMRALANDPDERPADARAFAAELVAEPTARGRQSARPADAAPATQTTARVQSDRWELPPSPPYAAIALAALGCILEWGRVSDGSWAIPLDDWTVRVAGIPIFVIPLLLFGSAGIRIGRRYGLAVNRGWTVSMTAGATLVAGLLFLAAVNSVYSEAGVGLFVVCVASVWLLVSEFLEALSERPIVRSRAALSQARRKRNARRGVDASVPAAPKVEPADSAASDAEVGR